MEFSFETIALYIFIFLVGVAAHWAYRFLIKDEQVQGRIVAKVLAIVYDTRKDKGLLENGIRRAELKKPASLQDMRLLLNLLETILNELGYPRQDAPHLKDDLQYFINRLDKVEAVMASERE